MDSALEITDPSDWLATSLSELSPLESALRCQVCKDFFDTPMMTSCSHTFCSLCIRKCLSSDGKCPACRAGDQASKLRQNWAIQEAVEAFTRARGGLIAMARPRVDVADNEAHSKRGVKRKWAGETADGDRRQTRSQSRPGASTSNELATIPDSEDSDYTPAPTTPRANESANTDALVACPICGKRMKEEYVFSHLDNCTAPSCVRHPPASTARAQKSSAPRTLQPIAQLNYSLLKDTAFRQKLADLGIPNWGTRQLLIRRHTEWVNIYNANCDSSNPRTKWDLLRELDVWERTMGGLATGGANLDVSKKDFDKDVWRTKNKGQFDTLVTDARERARKAKAAKEAAMTAETQDAATSRTVIADSQSPEATDETGTGQGPNDELVVNGADSQSERYEAPSEQNEALVAPITPEEPKAVSTIDGPQQPALPIECGGAVLLPREPFFQNDTP